MNDLFDASSKGTLNSKDVLLDSTSTDADILNATVTSSDIDSRIQNIETLNVKGAINKTGLDLSNVTGSKELNLSTTLSNGTAEVKAANTISVTNINAGANIAKLVVKSSAVGTRDTVNIDAGSASTVELTGSGSADLYDVTIVEDASVELKIFGANDKVTINANGDFDYKDAAAALENLVINGSEDLTVTVATGLADDTEVSNSGITTIKAAATVLNGNGITSTGTGKVKVALTDVADTDLSKAVVDMVDLSVAATSAPETLTVNENSTIVLSKDISHATNTVTVELGDAKNGIYTAPKTGYLAVEANASQGLASGFTTGSTVDTLGLKAGALADKADGTAQEVTFKNLTVDDATKTVVISGDNNLTLKEFTGAAGTIINASELNAKLTIEDIAEATTIYGSNNGDTITAVTDAMDLRAGSGDDTITTSGADTINAGAGDDTVHLTAGTGDTVTLGSGSDKVILTTTNTGSTIKDFTAGKDTLVVTGKGDKAVDLTNLSQTASLYTLQAGAKITLEGVTATDLSDSIQLGYTKADGTLVSFKVLDDVVTVAGDKDDVLEVLTTEAAKITTGAGSDTIIIDAAANNAIEITDFSATDKIILNTGGTAAVAILDLDKVAVTTGTTVTLGAVKVDFSNDILTVVSEKADLTSMIQLGTDATNAYEAKAGSVTGGTFDDFIDVADGASTTVNFIDNGGMDTILSFTAGGSADKLSFDGMANITAKTGTKITNTAVSATDGAVYVMSGAAISGDTVDYSKVGKTVNGEKVKVTDADIMADVAAYIANAIDKEATGESYIAIINASTIQSYAYEVTVGADNTITADDITLIGTIETDVALVAGDIA